jgi:hypothetical protein
MRARRDAGWWRPRRGLDLLSRKAVDRRFEDDRGGRLKQTAVGTGAAGGAVIGLLLGMVLRHFGGDGLLLISGAVGLMAGAWLGHAAAAHVDVEEMDPANATRPFVGVHAPDGDDDGVAVPARPLAAALKRRPAR